MNMNLCNNSLLRLLYVFVFNSHSEVPIAREIYSQLNEELNNNNNNNLVKCDLFI
jgi:hypothetical protein